MRPSLEKQAMLKLVIYCDKTLEIMSVIYYLTLIAPMCASKHDGAGGL